MGCYNSRQHVYTCYSCYNLHALLQKPLTVETKIIFAFLIYALVFTLESYLHPIQAGSLADMPIFAMIISVLGFLASNLNLKKKWREGLTSSKLSFGRNLKYYIVIPVALFLTLTLSYVLNYYT